MTTHSGGGGDTHTEDTGILIETMDVLPFPFLHFFEVLFTEGPICAAD